MNTFAIINIARQKLGMDEDAMRALYVRITRINSLRAMSERQRLAIVEELKRLGFKVQPGKSVKAKLEKSRPLANRPWSRHIHAMWRSCVALDVIDNGSVKALNAFCKRFVAPDDPKIAIDVDFLTQDQAAPIITALKAMEMRGKAGKA